MSIICPKCRFARPPDARAPEWQCPNCGVAYAKASGEAAPSDGRVGRDGRAGAYSSRGPEADSGGAIVALGKLVLIAAVVWGGWLGYQGVQRKMAAAEDGARSAQAWAELARATDASDIFMFSAEWCPACRDTHKWLDRHGFEYRSCDIDEDPGCLAEFQRHGSNMLPHFIIKGRHVRGFNADALGDALER